MRVVNYLKAQLKEIDAEKLFFEIDMPMIPVIAEMQAKGVELDVPFLKDMSKHLEQQIADLEQKIYDLAGQKRIADMAAKKKVTIIDISAKDLALMQKISEETLWKEWVKSINEKGLPGQKTLETWLKLVKKWEAKDPFMKKK